MINATTTANFALFNRKAKDTDEEGKEYPLMTGAISTDDWEVSVFAYKRVSKQGRTFLSLTIRNDGDEQTFTGMLFKDEKKTDAYYGFIEEQFLDVVDGANVYTKSDWQLSVRAKVTESQNPNSEVKFYISGSVYPSNSRASANSAARGTSEEKVAF